MSNSEDHKILFHQDILDKGFIRVVDQMGNDSAIVQAARVSYGIGTKNVSEDRGLIRYLMRHHHTTPFEMCEIKFHVKLPIFVARQWIRHRTASVNEYSARYSILDNEFYTPAVDNFQLQSTDNKQGRGKDFSFSEATELKSMIETSNNWQYALYEELLEKDLARETARMVLPTNIYTQWYWKVNLHNLFHFLQLRADPHAQMEIRVYAEAICNYVETWVPVAYEAFYDYRLNARTFSRMELDILTKYLIQGFKDADLETLSKREKEEFLKKIYNHI